LLRVAEVEAGEGEALPRGPDEGVAQNEVHDRVQVLSGEETFT
jgi:hypothetical protein